jgi:CAAX prenyl protease-like protein
MTILGEKLRASPIYARVIPYALVAALAFAGGKASGWERYWIYVVEMAVGLWCILVTRSVVLEMRWTFSWEAVAVGIFVFVFWVGLDPYYPQASKDKPTWNPFQELGANSVMAWFFVGVHTVGSAVVVPPIEEVFYRSFLYRYFVCLDFLDMPFSRLHWLSLIVTSLIFGFSHYQWLAGVLCGLSFQWLVLRKNRLGDAMTAHAITNFLLGIWVVWKDAWQFW